MGKLQYDTVDRRIILGHSRQDNCIRTQWLRQLHYDTVDMAVALGHSICENYMRAQLTQ